MIDSHHYLWSYSHEGYPWIPKTSPLARNHLVPELETVTSVAGVTGTIVVQARQTLAESDFLLSLADESDLIKAVVGWVPLTEKKVADHVEKYSAHQKFKAVQHNLQNEADDYFWRDDFNAGLALLPDYGLSYDLLISQRQIPAAIDLLDRQAELPVILNHIARPEARNGGIDPEWSKGIRELAKRDNLIGVKFSGILTAFPEGEGDLETVSAYFQETLEIFGTGNVMFGTDWPVCLLRSSYQDCTDVITYLTQGLSAHERDAILSTNAEICYRL